MLCGVSYTHYLIKERLMKTQLTVNLRSNDLTAIQEIAVAERRKHTDVIRNILEDVVEGRLSVEEVVEPKEKAHVTGIRMDAALKEKIARFKERTGLSADKAIHLALQVIHQTLPQKAIAGQASTDEITEYLIAQQIEEARANAAKKPYTEEEREAAIEALMHKHHHDGSSHKLEIRDESLADADLEDAA